MHVFPFRFANQTSYVILYGLVGCIFSMTYAYFNGTITTIEKRFKIPSKNTGLISVGNDISQMMVSAVLSYYAGKGHRPRWIGFGKMGYNKNILHYSLNFKIKFPFFRSPNNSSLLFTNSGTTFPLWPR